MTYHPRITKEPSCSCIPLSDHESLLRRRSAEKKRLNLTRYRSNENRTIEDTPKGRANSRNQLTCSSSTQYSLCVGMDGMRAVDKSNDIGMPNWY